VNKRDIATRILDKLIGENEYFEFLQDTSPVIFSSLKEKLKYFSPAFHSMTPEGLNSRLTFLQQCVRPGNTIETNGSTLSNNYISNTSFGKPPICILRIGDFYNTKMIIDSLNIEYNVVGNSVTYDLNPEGIGVQPMIAKVTASVRYVGGAGLREPVLQLQNALSFNYYANADIYESMSYGQTNVDERYLDNLELAYNSDELDISQLKLSAYSKINPVSPANFTYIGNKLAAPSSYTLTPSDRNYNPDHIIKSGIDVVQYYDVDYSAVFKQMYSDYTSYISGYIQTMESAGLYQQDGSQYDFFLFIYSAMLNLSTNYGANGTLLPTAFGQNKNVDTVLFPQLANPFSVSPYAGIGYFNIGYDSYMKSNNSASLTLHLYPQQNDRIVNPAAFGIGTFAGCVLPYYFDDDYVNQNIDVFVRNFKAKISCDEWFGFSDDLRGQADRIPTLALLAFRNTITSALDSYVTQLKTKWNTAIEKNFTSFRNVYTDILEVVPIINGIDGGTSPSSGIDYLEVAPILSTGTTTSLDTFFNITNDDVFANYPYDIDEMAATPWQTVYGYTDDIYRGNFRYLADQVTNNDWVVNHYDYYDFSDGQWKKDGTPTTVFITSIFEKLNYEFLYFSNITLDALKQDSVTAVAKEFGISQQTRDFSNLSAARQSDIRTAFSVAAGATTYNYYTLKYTGTTDSDFANNPYINQLYSLEDILFYGFISSAVALSTFIQTLQTAMLQSSTPGVYSSDQQSLITNFTTMFSGTLNRIIAFKSLDPMLTKFGTYDENVTEDWNAISDKFNTAASNPADYTLKMFEVDYTRANANGKSLLNAYYKFKTANPTT
jgi:hypothetical protein